MSVDEVELKALLSEILGQSPIEGVAKLGLTPKAVAIVAAYAASIGEQINDEIVEIPAEQKPRVSLILFQLCCLMMVVGGKAGKGEKKTWLS